MLLPLFDKNCDHVGWIKPGNHIFNTDMAWVAYLVKDHAWSAHTGNWLGPVNDLLCCQDRYGRAVAWTLEEGVIDSALPTRPARAARTRRPAHPTQPGKPTRPIRPATPVGGWSPQTFLAWIEQ